MNVQDETIIYFPKQNGTKSHEHKPNYTKHKRSFFYIFYFLKFGTEARGGRAL